MLSAETTVDNWLTLTRSIGPSVLVIVGWLIVSWQHNKRETRKDIRQFLDKTISFTEQLINKTLDCYECTNQAEKDIKSHQIAFDIMRLESNLKMLNSSLKSSIDTTKLNSKITISPSFASAAAIADSHINHIESVTTEAYEIIKKLEDAYRKSYH